MRKQLLFATLGALAITAVAAVGQVIGYPYKFVVVQVNESRHFLAFSGDGHANVQGDGGRFHAVAFTFNCEHPIVGHGGVAYVARSGGALTLALLTQDRAGNQFECPVTLTSDTPDSLYTLTQMGELQMVEKPQQ